MKSLVSIVIPVYNVEKFLDRCIQSVINQTYPDLQIILVDDGSADRSGLICDEYAKKDSRITVIHTENKGVSSARNTGISLVDGEYLCFLDSDDALETDIIRKSLKRMNDTDADLVVFGWKKIYSNKLPEEMIPQIGVVIDLESALKDLLQNFRAFGGGYPNKLWRVNTFDRFPQYDINLYYFEDSEWMVRMFQRIKKISFLNEIGYLYYIREDSVTFNSVNNERREIGYHLSMQKIISDLASNQLLCIWFRNKYYTELVNGVIHAKRNDWQKLYKKLIQEVTRSKRLILKSNIKIRTKLRFLFILLFLSFRENE